MAGELPIKERLDKHSIPVTESGCWLWTGGCDSRGWPFLPYGRIWVRGRTLNAHRVAYEAYLGPIPTGMKVLHKCDTPSCINPEHLMLGTAKDNTRDMMKKGRNEPMLTTRRGERSNFNKLSISQVLAIRSDGRLQRIIADEYGISQSCVSHLKARKNWRHI